MLDRSFNIKTMFLSLYFICLLLFTVYQDFPFSNYIGHIGSSPIVLLSPIFLITELICFLRTKRKIIKLTKLQLIFLIFLFYLAIISVLYNIGLYIFENEFTSYGENLSIKALKVLAYFFLVLLYIRHLYIVLKKFTNKSYILFYSFLFVTSVLYLLMIYEHFTVPKAFLFLHSNSEPYWRIRLLTSESSHTGLMVIVFIGITFYLVRILNTTNLKKSIIYTYLVSFLCVYSTFTSSKGFIISLILTFVFIGLIKINLRYKYSILYLIAGVAIGSIIFLIVDDTLITAILNDLKKFSSITTRLGTIFVSLLILVHHPFGVGTGAYIYFFPQYIDSAIQLTKDVILSIFSVNGIDTTELMNYKMHGNNLSAKSGFFQLLIYGGIGSILFFLRLILYLKNYSSRSIVLSFVFWFVIFSIVIYQTIEIKYEVWLFFVFLEVLPNIKKKNVNQDSKYPVYM